MNKVLIRFLCLFLSLQASAHIIPFGFLQTYAPVLDWNFTTSTTLPSQLTFTRSSTATYYNSSGVLSSASTNTPRFDYNPSTLALRGLLMEAAATNLFPISEQVDAMSAYMVNITANNTTGPDGASTADKVVPNTTNGLHEVYITTTLATATQYTYSLFVKSTGYQNIAIGMDNNAFAGNAAIVNFNLSTQVITNLQATPQASGIVSVGNGWYRIWITNTTTAADTAGIIVLFLDNSGNTSFAGNGTSGLYLYGFQVELGAIATSYIPTAGSTVTRAADKAIFNTMTWYNSDSGALFAQYINQGAESSSTFRSFGLFGTNVAGTFSQNSIDLSDSGTTNKSAVTTSSSMVFNPAGSLNSASTANKVALGYSAANYSFVMNGGLVTNQVSGSLPSAATTAYIGSQPDGNMRNRWLQKIQYYNKKVQDAFLKNLTL